MPDTLVLDAHEEAPKNALIPQNELASIVAARDAAIARMAEAAGALDRAYEMAESAVSIRSRATGGETFGLRDRTKDEHYGNLFRGYFDKAKSVDVWRAEVDASVWQHLFTRTGMFDMMDMTAKEEWRKSLMNDVPEVTLENLYATLETVAGDADLIFKRGIAKVFAELDRRFRSHDGFKIGSRIILNNAFTDYGSIQYGRKRDMIIDIERVLAKLDGEKPDPHSLLTAVENSRKGHWGPMQSEVEAGYLRIKGYKNGNAHLWFTCPALVEKVNKLLAEYYGELIPDAHPKDTKPESFTSKSGLPSKDLAYYFTPKKASDELFDRCSIRTGARVLEPSAGTGHLVRAMIGLDRDLKIDAIEIHPERVAALKLIRHPNLRVQQANFLQTVPNPVYDYVVMNPPFSGTHWMEHVVHAFDFLKPGGLLYSILPASAEVMESPKHEKFRAWADLNKERWGWQWRELPPEAFVEAGTRINTVILSLHKK